MNPGYPGEPPCRNDEAHDWSTPTADPSVVRLVGGQEVGFIRERCRRCGLIRLLSEEPKRVLAFPHEEPGKK